MTWHTSATYRPGLLADAGFGVVAAVPGTVCGAGTAAPYPRVGMDHDGKGRDGRVTRRDG